MQKGLKELQVLKVRRHICLQYQIAREGGDWWCFADNKKDAAWKAKICWFFAEEMLATDPEIAEHGDADGHYTETNCRQPVLPARQIGSGRWQDRQAKEQWQYSTAEGPRVSTFTPSYGECD